jgi:hypothetical protein
VLLVWLVVDDFTVGALPIEQRLPVSVKKNGSHPPDDDCVAVSRQNLLDYAINSDKYIFENRCAVARQPRPIGTAIAVLALQSAAT